ncbi:MAG: MFS transporter [Dysgonamonadaceae bacterium]
MKQQLEATLRDSAASRWAALLILSFAMFGGYMFTEIISPLKTILERAYGWDSTDFGIVTSSYGLFNVFFLMLLIVGILLDKFGIRISNIISGVLMLVGGLIKYLAFKEVFSATDTINVLGIWQMKEQVFFAAFGYAIFGVGAEYAGITISKALVKWFKGREIALAMGIQVAIARLGSFGPLLLGAYFAGHYGVANWLFFGVLLLIAGLIAFLYYNMMDRKLDSQLNKTGEKTDEEEEFKISDLSKIVANKGFWLITILCLLFYSAVFPFYKYGSDLMVNKFGVSEQWAGAIPSLLPLGTMLLTPVFGSIYDKKGKGASIMILGAMILVVVHIIFYLPFLTNISFAIVNVLLLGVAFSLVPSAIWPSVPKIIPEKQLGSAYAVIFWIQNFGLWGIPLLIGIVLDKTNPQVGIAKAAGKIVPYDYSKTWLIFVVLTILAVFVSLMLKKEDRIKGYGLEKPNINKE